MSIEFFDWCPHGTFRPMGCGSCTRLREALEARTALHEAATSLGYADPRTVEEWERELAKLRKEVDKMTEIARECRTKVEAAHAYIPATEESTYVYRAACEAVEALPAPHPPQSEDVDSIDDDIGLDDLPF